MLVNTCIDPYAGPLGGLAFFIAERKTKTAQGESIYTESFMLFWKDINRKKQNWGT